MSPASLCGKRVFVVDDEATIADTLGLILREAGFAVSTFYDGQAAFEHAQQENPDIVLSDIEMPKMDGLTLASKLQEQLPQCRVLLISGNATYSSEFLSKWRNSGRPELEILAKPVRPEIIIRKVMAMAVEGAKLTSQLSKTSTQQ